MQSASHRAVLPLVVAIALVLAAVGGSVWASRRPVPLVAKQAPGITGDAPAFEDDMARSDAAKANETSYACASGKSLVTRTELGMDGTASNVTVTLEDGTRLPLAASGSMPGTRYADAGERAVLTVRDGVASLEVEGKVTHEGCVAR